MQSYVSQATHAFLGMLPLCFLPQSHFYFLNLKYIHVCNHIQAIITNIFVPRIFRAHHSSSEEEEVFHGRTGSASHHLQHGVSIRYLTNCVSSIPLSHSISPSPFPPPPSHLPLTPRIYPWQNRTCLSPPTAWSKHSLFNQLCLPFPLPHSISPSPSPIPSPPHPKTFSMAEQDLPLTTYSME